MRQEDIPSNMTAKRDGSVFEMSDRLAKKVTPIKCRWCSNQFSNVVAYRKHLSKVHGKD